jgi:hypothetical protein
VSGHATRADDIAGPRKILKCYLSVVVVLGVFGERESGVLAGPGAGLAGFGGGAGFCAST